jgi:hypothetical protein
MADLYSFDLKTVPTAELEDVAKAFDHIAADWKRVGNAEGLVSFFGDVALCFREELACREADVGGGLRAVMADLGADSASAIVRALALIADQIDARIDDDEAATTLLEIVAHPIRQEVIRRQLIAAAEATDSIPSMPMN